MRTRNKVYITQSDARCVRVAQGLLAAVRSQRKQRAFKVYLCLKLANVQGRIKRGSVTEFATSQWCKNNFSLATFWNGINDLITLGAIVKHNDDYVLRSHDYFCSLFGIDSNTVKHFSIPSVQFQKGLFIEFLETTEIFYNKTQQAKTIASKLVNNDRQYGIGSDDPFHFKRHYANVMRNSTERHSQVGVAKAEPTHDGACDIKMNHNTVDVNFDINCSLARYCLMLGISCKSQAAKKLRHLESVGYVSVTNRSEWEDILPTMEHCYEYNYAQYKYVGYRITVKCNDVQTVIFQ